MNSKIWLSSPHMGGREQYYVQKAFEENWIAPLGPNVDGFENDLATYLGNEVHVAALSSGTAALHLALILLGVEAGDEVICQSFTFAASANPIVYQGAKPIFVDSEPDTLNISPKHLEAAIQNRIANGTLPKAIILVHLYGMPAKMDELMAIAKTYGIPVIEDAAEALGSKYRGQNLGTFGDLSILSFNGNKIITTSGGGALVSRNSGLIARARFLATQARDQAPHYQHSNIGYNYRLSNICAGIGRGQMEVLNERVARRREVYEYYKAAFKEIPGIQLADEPDANYFCNRWLSTIFVDSSEIRDEIRLGLEQNNIEARPLWKPMHLQPVFSGAGYYGEGICDGLFETGLCLPSGSNLSEEDLARVVETVKELMLQQKMSEKPVFS